PEPVISPRSRADRLHGIACLSEDRLEDDEAAEKAYQEALDLDPENVGAALGLMLFHLRRGNEQKLAESLARYSGGFPTEARSWAYAELGDLLESRLGALRGALAAYERALEHGPNDLGTLRALSRLQTKLNGP